MVKLLVGVRHLLGLATSAGAFGLCFYFSVLTRIPQLFKVFNDKYL